MPKGSMRILVKNLPETNPKTRTEPAWKKPIVEYPKDARITEVTYKWNPEKKAKPKRKAKPVKKEKPRQKPGPKKKVKRTLTALSGNERRNWTEEDVEKLIEMYNDGASYVEISEVVRHAESSIATKLTKLRKAGRITSTRSQESWTQEQVDTLLAMKAQGRTLEEVSVVIKKSYAAVWCKYRKIKAKEKEWEE